MTKEEFERRKRALLRTLPAADDKLTEHLKKTESAANKALTTETALKSSIKIGASKSLGIFAEGDDYFCHSLLMHAQVKTGTNNQSVIQATSIAAMWIEDQIVTMSVNALYERPEDLRWAQIVCKSTAQLMQEQKRSK